MLVLYYGAGASADGNAVVFSTTDHFHEYKKRLCDLLDIRGEKIALELVNKFEWGLRPSEFWVGDSYEVLFAGAYVADYEYARSTTESPAHVAAFHKIAEVLMELGVSELRYIGVDLSPDPKVIDPSALTDKEIKRLVTDYIGVIGGYLGDFSYKTHREFYEELDLPYKPDSLQGTTREKFISILSQAPPRHQAKMLEGILERFPKATKPERTEELRAKIRSWIVRLNGAPAVQIAKLQTTNDTVQRALSDAESLLSSSGATSAVDRVHTALHGYMKGIAASGGLSAPEDASLTQLFKLLRGKHPNLQELGPRAEDISKALQGLASVIDALNPLRNKASIAHPNLDLLAEPEALLVINSVKTILNYLDKKLSAKN
jgi:uncharacterized protein YjgD (DUF1641 family)